MPRYRRKNNQVAGDFDCDREREIVIKADKVIIQSDKVIVKEEDEDHRHRFFDEAGDSDRRKDRDDDVAGDFDHKKDHRDDDVAEDVDREDDHQHRRRERRNPWFW